ncbi:MAG: ATP-binding protein [Saprospiraceae bacterium]
MYFITYGGLSVYDGVIFKNYNQQDGLSNELVNDLIEVTPDSILIATNAGPLNTLVRGKMGVFHTPDSSQHVINRFLKSLDGSLYAVGDDGFYKLIKNNFIKIPLLSPQGTDIGYNLDRITEWKNYLLLMPWNYTQREKVIIYDKTKNVVAGLITKEGYVSNTAATPGGELWLSTETGLMSLDFTSLQQGNIVLNPVTSIKNASQLNNAFIYFDPHRDVWIYQNNVVHHFLPSGADQVFSTDQGLTASRISDLFVDREDIIWLSSDGNGIIKIPGTNVQILGDLIPGVRNSIAVLYQQSDTTWLFNNTNHSFYRIHDRKITAFPLSGNNLNVANLYIRGESLCFVWDQKIYSIAHKDLASSYAHPVQIFPDSKIVLEVGAIKVTPDHFIIQYIRENDSTFNLYVLKDLEVVMKQKLTFALDQMAFDSNHLLWTATRDNKLIVYSLHPESPERYLHVEDDFSEAIKGIGPRAIALDKTENVWIGTRYNGIYQFTFKEKKMHSSLHFTTHEGLTDNFYYHLYCDADNTLWAGSQTGLDKISFKNGAYVIENITKSKNMFQGIYNVINVSKDMIWALTSNGEIITVSGTDSRRMIMPPAFFITSLFVNDVEYDVDIDHSFTYDHNNLSIRVAAPSFTDEKSILYSYHLKGSNKNSWSQPSNTALFNFINLSPGAYELYIKAEFPAAKYPPQTLIYSFNIRPPFWRTWWFLITLSLLIISLFVLALRYSFTRKLVKQRLILESKQAMEKERTRIATDMHDDLGAGLTRIKFLSETIGFNKQLNLPVDEEINNIRTHAHDMIDKMGEIVWALNEKNDSLSDLLAYTRSYAVSYLSENGIKCIVDAPDDFTSLEVSGEFRRNIYLVVKEALHNIVKHAEANVVHIRFEISKDLKILIQDDGIGFDPTNIRPYSNGILNMEKRMTSINGELKINNEHGTTIILSAPLPL